MWIKLGITHLKFWQEIQKNSFLMEDTIMSCRYVIYEILHCWDGQVCIKFGFVDPLFIDFGVFNFKEFQTRTIIYLIDPEKHIYLVPTLCPIYLVSSQYVKMITEGVRVPAPQLSVDLSNIAYEFNFLIEQDIKQIIN